MSRTTCHNISQFSRTSWFWRQSRRNRVFLVGHFRMSCHWFIPWGHSRGDGRRGSSGPPTWFPMKSANNSQWNFHFPDTEHRPAKSFHSLGQTVPSVEHWQQKDTQVDDRQLAHHLYPSNRRKRFPSYLCNRFPLYPLRTNFLQPISHLMYKKLRFIYWV